MQELLRKWESTAKADLIHDDFNEFLSVNKGLQKYLESTDVLNEDSLRGQTALLNASLIHQYSGALSYFDIGRAQQCLARLDHVLHLAGKMAATHSLTEFLPYARTCFYYRLGDFHLVSLLKTCGESTDQNQLSTVLCCYSLALVHGLSKDLDALSPAEALNVLELTTVIEHNVKYIGGVKVLVEAMASKDLASRLSKGVFSEKNNLKFGLENDKVCPFMRSDLPVVVSKFPAMCAPPEKLLTIAWSARRHSVFLRKFFWLVAHRERAQTDLLLEECLPRLPKVPRSLNLSYTVDDFSLLDLKVFLFRLSDHFERSFCLDKSVVAPSHFYQTCSKPVSRLWNILNVIFDLGSNGKLSSSDEIHFTTALEEIRMYLNYETDPIGLVNTTIYTFDEISGEQQRLPAIELFERYAKMSLQVLKGQHCAQQKSALFPAIRKPGSSKIVDKDDLEYQVRFHLARLAILKRNTSKALEILSSLKPRFKDSDRVQKLMKELKNEELPLDFDYLVTCGDSLNKTSIDDTFMTANSRVSNSSNSTLAQASNDNFEIIKTKEEEEKEKRRKRDEYINKRLIQVLDKYLQIGAAHLKELQKLAGESNL